MPTPELNNGKLYGGKLVKNSAMTTRGKLSPTMYDIRYLCGVLDADGCIGIGKMKAGPQRTKNPRYALMVTIVNTNENLMLWLVEKFGGSYNGRQKEKPEHKTTYNWRFNNSKAYWLLKLVEPHLIVKKKQAQIGIDLIENWTVLRGRGAITPETEVARREALYQQMKMLNRTGNTAATTECSGPHLVHGVMRQSELMGNHKREARSGIPAIH